MLNYLTDNLSKKEIRSEIAWRLHYERICAKLSLEELAEKTGYSKPTVQRWERGWKTGTGENLIPTLDQLLSLCKLYHCTPEYLLCEYDEKTKVATDVARELGLSEETTAWLQRHFRPLIDDPEHRGANDLFMAFINYLIVHMDLLTELLFNRSILTYTKIAFQDEPDCEIITEAFNSVTSNGLACEILKDGIFKDTGAKKRFKTSLKEYFTKKGFDIKRTNHLIKQCMYYYDILSPSKTKQSDFALSDSFLDIVKDFFTDFDDNVFEYMEYVKTLK